MECPDEDTVAQLLQGLLPADELARLEQHLDECPACTELVAELGKAYEHSAEPLRVAPIRKPEPSDLTRVELFAVAIHALITAKLGWLIAAGRLDIVTAVHPMHPSTVALLVCGAWFGPIGGITAAFGAWALGRRRSWANRAAAIHAALVLPSVVLTPLSIYVLVRLRALRAAG
jgi:anti-sigma factor RsiW